MDQFVELMRNATELVGIEAVRLWPKMVFLHWIKGVGNMITFASLATIGFVVIWKKSNMFDDDKSTGRDFAVLIIGAAFAFVGAMGLLIEGPNLLARIFEPEADLVLRLFQAGGK